MNMFEPVLISAHVLFGNIVLKANFAAVFSLLAAARCLASAGHDSAAEEAQLKNPL